MGRASDKYLICFRSSLEVDQTHFCCRNITKSTIECEESKKMHKYAKHNNSNTQRHTYYDVSVRQRQEQRLACAGERVPPAIRHCLSFEGKSARKDHLQLSVHICESPWWGYLEPKLDHSILYHLKLTLKLHILKLTLRLHIRIIWRHLFRQHCPLSICTWASVAETRAEC